MRKSFDEKIPCKIRDSKIRRKAAKDDRLSTLVLCTSCAHLRVNGRRPRHHRSLSSRFPLFPSNRDPASFYLSRTSFFLPISLLFLVRHTAYRSFLRQSRSSTFSSNLFIFFFHSIYIYISKKSRSSYIFGNRKRLILINRIILFGTKKSLEI